VALPKIESYALPVGSELPAARVPWRLTRSRAALLIHDMQRYFVDAFPAGLTPIKPVVEHIAALHAACAHAGVPTFFTAQPGNQDRRDRGLQADFWGPGMQDQRAHTDIVEELAPAPDDIVLTKWRYSAFQRSSFEAMLRARGRDQLIVTGVYAHIGCQVTAADAFMRDIEPFFVADAVASFSRAQHDDAIRAVAGCCGAVTSTARVLGDLA
jgi:bifunctional isochorismate lyase/aryl carrier protein